MHLHVTNEFERDHIASHAITEEIERKLEREFGKVTATIHVEPSPKASSNCAWELQDYSGLTSTLAALLSATFANTSSRTPSFKTAVVLAGSTSAGSLSSRQNWFERNRRARSAPSSLPPSSLTCR